MFNFSVSALRRIPAWLWEVRYFWLAAALTIAAIGVASFFRTEAAFRWTGLGLQLAGGLTVWWAIAETHQSFGHPSFINRAKKWLRKFPLLKQPPLVLRGSGVSQMNLSAGDLDIRHRLGPNASIEQRLTALQTDFDRLYDRHVAFASKTNQTHREHKKLLESEKQARLKDRREIELKIEETATGGLHIPSIGGVWILVGSVMGTLSVELAAWLAQ